MDKDNRESEFRINARPHPPSLIHERVFTADSVQTAVTREFRAPFPLVGPNVASGVSADVTAVTI